MLGKIPAVINIHAIHKVPVERRNPIRELLPANGMTKRMLATAPVPTAPNREAVAEGLPYVKAGTIWYIDWPKRFWMMALSKIIFKG
jgi:hypothetical protein